MNAKTCKDCPCCDPWKDGFQCRLNPPQVYNGDDRNDSSYTEWPWVDPDDWCYRGREIIRQEAAREQAPF